MLATTPSTRAPFAPEARVLYTLLDAADSLGRIENTSAAGRWRELDARLRSRGNYADEAETMHGLLVQIHAENALTGTWIEERWRAIAARIVQAAETAKTRSPF